MSRGFKEVKKQNSSKSEISRQNSYGYLLKVENNGDEHATKAKMKFHSLAYGSLRNEVKK